jgi:hypothetical protein
MVGGLGGKHDQEAELMWSRMLENTHFLLSIYGHFPSLENVEVTRLEIDRVGLSLMISFITKGLPYKPPTKWGLFNRVYFQIQFFGLEEINLSQFLYTGSTTIRMWDHEDGIAMECSGAVSIGSRCKFARIAMITGLLVDEDSH